MAKKRKDDTTALLTKINDSLGRIDKRLAQLLEKQDQILNNLTSLPSARSSDINVQGLEDFPLDVVTLLSLPDHLRKTAMILCQEGEATADQVSAKTGRARAVESGYLNQLHTMMYVKKKRKGRDVYFYVER